MNMGLLIAGIVGTGIVFAIAAWAGPKVIRAMYPEEQHERMIKMHRMMVIIAIIVAVIGFMSGIPAYMANSAG